MSVGSVNTGYSYYVNPNSRTVTSDIKNTAVYDKEVYRAMSSTLRPIEDMVNVLNTPLNLASKTSINKSTNSLNIALGTTIQVPGGFTLMVKENGVQVTGVTDWNNYKESQEAQDMGGALATLLRNAGGTWNDVGHTTADRIRWTEDVTKILNYLGIDTSKDFTVNGMKYSRDENGNFISQAKSDAMEAYEQQTSANRTYEFADEKTKKQIAYMSNYFLRTAPESVAKAWQETLEETGINPFPEGYGSILQQLATEQDFQTGGNDNLFGETVESSVEAVNAILERIENPIGKTESDDSEFLSNQKEFYTTLLEKIQNKSNHI